jgi:hypothetical protein
MARSSGRAEDHRHLSQRNGKHLPPITGRTGKRWGSREGVGGGRSSDDRRAAQPAASEGPYFIDARSWREGMGECRTWLIPLETGGDSAQPGPEPSPTRSTTVPSRTLKGARARSRLAPLLRTGWHRQRAPSTSLLRGTYSNPTRRISRRNRRRTETAPTGGTDLRGTGLRPHP